MANKIFPEYITLPDRSSKMPAHEQVELGKKIMDRMDDILDEDTIVKIRHKHTCNLTKNQVKEIEDLKEEVESIEELCKKYSRPLTPGYVKKDDDVLTVSFGWGRCVCNMYRKLDEYEPVSKTWCECCNGHVIKIYNRLLERPVSSEMIETVASGGDDCIFEIRYER
ncbi:MAG: DUF6144 family protein [Thermoplasmata archaeon]